VEFISPRPYTTVDLSFWSFFMYCWCIKIRVSEHQQWFNQVTWWFCSEPPQTLHASSSLSRYPTPAPVNDFVLLFSCHHAARTWSCQPPGPSSRAYLFLHSSKSPQGQDLSCLLFTCINANPAVTCTWNTRPRVSPHHIVNHSSHQGATIH
jgi:hypothetical protein